MIPQCSHCLDALTVPKLHADSHRSLPWVFSARLSPQRSAVLPRLPLFLTVSPTPFSSSQLTSRTLPPPLDRSARHARSAHGRSTSQYHPRDCTADNLPSSGCQTARQTTAPDTLEGSIAVQCRTRAMEHDDVVASPAPRPRRRGGRRLGGTV
eukprot:COSAG02_NODE_1929_length_10336_cov_69.703819_9_plen_153_part_00